MTHKILGIWLYFSLCTIAFAQTPLKFKGFVLDADTSEPVEGAYIIGSDHYAVTSSTGEFAIKNIAEGVRSFKVSHIGYQTENVTIHVYPEMEVVEILLKIAAREIEEVAVYGKSREQRAKEVPVVSYSVDKDFLDQNRENSLMQTLEKLPGVSTISIGSGQSKPVIRGLGFNRVAVVQNGIKHEAQQWGSDHGLEIDQYGIESVQIIKGPASLLYGSDAIAGVVNIESPVVPLKDTFEGEVNLLAESNNDLFGISAGIQHRKDKWYYRGRLTYKDYGDYKVPTDQIRYENYIFQLHDNNLRNTAGNEANASTSVGYLSEKVKSETFISNVHAKNGFFANAHGLEVRTSGIDYDHSSRDTDLPFHKVNHFKITNNTTVLAGGHTLHIDLGFQNNAREEHSEPVPHGYMPKPDNTKERAFNKNTYTLGFRDKLKPLGEHRLVAGLNAEYQDNNIGGWGFLIPSYQRFTVGGFIYDQYELHPDLHLLAGLRYDYGTVDTQSYYDWYQSPVNDADGTTSYEYRQRARDKHLSFGNFSGSVGVSYIRGNTTYKLNLGKSFRMPLANELASDGVNYHMYRYERGNAELEAEESYQLDVDIEHAGKKLMVGISPFVNYFGNYIYLNPTPEYYETLQIYEYTQSKVFRIGGELRLGIEPIKNLRFDVAGEYVYSVQTNGAKEGFTLPFSPPLSGLFTGSYQFEKLLFLKKSLLTASYRITAAQNEIVPPEETTAGYQVLNMSLETELNLIRKKTPLKVRVKLNNVFDEKYFNHTSFYRLIDVPEPGRNIAVSLIQTFN